MMLIKKGKWMIVFYEFFFGFKEDYCKMLVVIYLSIGLFLGLYSGRLVLNVKDFDMIKIYKKRF